MDERLIPAIYEAALEPERWASLFTELSSEMGGAAVYLGQSFTDRFGIGDFWTVGVDPGGWNSFGASEQSAQTNRTLAALLRSEGRVVDRREIIPDADVGRDQLSRVFLAENGLFHATVSVVQRDDQVASTLWIARDRAHEIEGTAFENIRMLAPHIGQAMRIHRSLRRSAADLSMFRSVLDGLTRGVALLDGGLRLLYANAAAACALEAGRGIVEHFDRLCANAPRQQRALQDHARRLTDGMGDLRIGTLIVCDAQGEPAWRVTLAPAVGASANGFAEGARIIAFIDDLARAPDEPRMENLAKWFGLTLAEARVAALSARALRPGEIAATLGVSVNTVKTQLKVVHARLGVRSQAELVRTVLTLRDG
ncbi:helix-turn-helix transcriptional regulator [uncultured Jannaschia sp.]|uniref:helix-turn-helix transcriptional regulator n=1 Tax=uncultured Jannaschia sp. TaxID=293347 RepID=UPI002603DC71|nr:helix-turn-helix transcriptional regulator [uncultured Jannaschia sp.]